MRLNYNVEKSVANLAVIEDNVDVTTEYIPTSADFKSGVVLERDWGSEKIRAVTDYCIYVNTDGHEVLEVTAPTMDRLRQTSAWAPLSLGNACDLSYRAITHIVANVNTYSIREVHLFGVNLSEDPLVGLSFNERCRKLIPSLLHIKSFKAKA